MKGRMLVFWLFVFAGLWAFFWSFGTSTFQRQEEVQLFIPEWSVVRDMLSVPGGFCTVCGQALVQYYASSLFVLCVNSTFLCMAGFLCYLLLQEIAPRGYNLLLSLFPVLGLLKAHTSPFYVLDGTVGLFLLLLFNGGAVALWRGECCPPLWFGRAVGGALRLGRGFHESFVPEEKMVCFACCMFDRAAFDLYRHSFGHRHTVDRRDLLGKISGVPVAAGLLYVLYLDSFCCLAFDFIRNGFCNENFSLGKTSGKSTCCRRLVCRSVLFFRILLARAV